MPELRDADTRCGELYLQLLKQCLTRYIVIDEEVYEVGVPSFSWQRSRAAQRAWAPVRTALAHRGLRLVRTGGNRRERAEGRDWPTHAETMVGLARLDNIEYCVRTVVEDKIPGDLIETGVWRGGASIFMRAVLEAVGDTERLVWLADSFRGLPPPDTTTYPADAGGDLSKATELAVGLDQVRANFAKYRLLDNRVRFLEGWFRDTLPSAPIDHLAVLRLDGDYYESTTQALTALYPKLSPGGYVIVDDYNVIDGCKKAVDDYRSENGITGDIVPIDGVGVYWRRT